MEVEGIGVRERPGRLRRRWRERAIEGNGRKEMGIWLLAALEVRAGERERVFDRARVAVGLGLAKWRLGLGLGPNGPA